MRGGSCGSFPPPMQQWVEDPPQEARLISSVAVSDDRHSFQVREPRGQGQPTRGHPLVCRADEQSIKPAGTDQLIDFLAVFVGDDQLFEAHAGSVQECSGREQQAFGHRTAL